MNKFSWLKISENRPSPKSKHIQKRGRIRIPKVFEPDVGTTKPLSLDGPGFDWPPKNQKSVWMGYVRYFTPFWTAVKEMGFYVSGGSFHLYAWHKNQQLGPPSSRRCVKQIVIFLWPARGKSGTEEWGWRISAFGCSIPMEAKLEHSQDLPPDHLHDPIPWTGSFILVDGMDRPGVPITSPQTAGCLRNCPAVTE